MNDDEMSSPALLRATYQQKAAAYLFDTFPLIPRATDAARFLSLRAVYDRSEPSCLERVEQIRLNESVCMACGTLSYPMNTSSATILRSLKRGRTRRRRASRSKAAQLIKETVQKQRMGNTNTNPQLRKEIIEENQRIKLANLHRLGDGRSKHCVVNTCGFCGNERKKKGIEVKSIQKSYTKSIQKPKRDKSNSLVDSKKLKCEKDEFKDSNFISLPGKPAAAMPKTGFSFKQKKNTNPPLLLGGKKKKAKKQAAGSKLMDFLSSLND
jgi:hypothetical protein